MDYHEDEHGHLINEAGVFVYDPRCYGCLAERGPARVTAVRVDIPAQDWPPDDDTSYVDHAREEWDEQAARAELADDKDPDPGHSDEVAR